ncbi:MAG: hypothetical protein KME17_21675 [Cyanosarcina radialis HA8281-LM2]|jgi:hypothetical protein|nr:hypothetical protein [Cyanosarcina radialis HA8281-LM2]
MSKPQWFRLSIEWILKTLLVIVLTPAIDLFTGDRISKTVCDTVYVFLPLPDPPEKFQPVWKLADVGLDGEARKKLSEIIVPTSSPSSTTTSATTEQLPEKLRYLSDKQPYCVDNNWQENYERYQLISIILVLCLVLSILILRIFPELYNLISKNLPYQKIKLEIKDFNDEVSELKIGKSTAAMVKSSIAGDGSLGETLNIYVAEGAIDKPDIEIDIEPIATPIKILSQLLRIFDFSPSYTLSGDLQKSPDKGLGLSLTLNQSNRVIDTETIWQNDYDYRIELSKTNCSNFENILADITAIWTLFKIDEKKAKEWLGVQNWKSYAYSQVAAYWMLVGKHQRAKYATDKALIYDKNNRFALFNLGIIATKVALSLYSQGDDPKKILSLLSQANNLFDRAERRAKKYQYQLITIPSIVYTDPVFYKAKYQQCTVYLYKLIIFLRSNSDRRVTIYSSIYRLAIEFFLVIKNEELVADISKFPKINRNNELQEFLEKIELITKIMRAEILVRMDDKPGAEKLISEILVDLKTTVNSQVAEAKSKFQTRLCDEQKESIYDYYIPTNNPLLPGLGHYNLACYYSALAEKENEIKPSNDNCQHLWCHLEYALGRDSTLVEWARIDPSLQWLRDNIDLSIELDKILRKYDRP